MDLNFLSLFSDLVRLNTDPRVTFTDKDRDFWNVDKALPFESPYPTIQFVHKWQLLKSNFTIDLCRIFLFSRNYHVNIFHIYVKSYHSILKIPGDGNQIAEAHTRVGVPEKLPVHRKNWWIIPIFLGLHHSGIEIIYTYIHIYIIEYVYKLYIIYI